MLTYEDLREPERAVWDAMETGTLVELPLGGAVSDVPAADANSGEEREVRAQLLYELLCGGRGKGPRSRALRLAGARITGTLDLEAAILACPVTLQDCDFEEAVNLSEAQAPALRLPGCQLPGLNAEQLEIRGNLALNQGFTARDGVDLRGAHIGGQIDLGRASLSNSNGPALKADGLTVGQSMLCNNGFHAHGEVRLRGAHVGGDVSFLGAELFNRKGPALSADGLAVDQDMVCEDMTAEGEVRIPGVRVGGKLTLSRARLANSGRSALYASGIIVRHNMDCSELTAEGEVRLRRAHIAGDLKFSRATLTNPDKAALYAGGLTVDHNMLCALLTTKGEVRLRRANVGGYLTFVGATLANARAPALYASGLTVHQNMRCPRLTTTGEVRLRRAHIGGYLSFIKAMLNNANGTAMNASGITVGHDFRCRELSAKGEVRLIGGKVDGQLDFMNSSIENSSGLALCLENLIAHSLYLQPATTPAGIIDLTNAHVTHFYDDENSWCKEARLRLQGFVYDTVGAGPKRPPLKGSAGRRRTTSTGTPVTERRRRWIPQILQRRRATAGVDADSIVDARSDVEQRLRWLERNASGYAPQLYDQLASVYRQAGRDDDARKVAIAKQRRRRSILDRRGKIWNSLLRWTIGYGYRTWLAGVWLGGFLLAGSVIFARAYPAHFTPTKRPGEPLTHFQPFIYALDTLLPVVDLHQQNSWVPSGFAEWWAWASVLAGWVLTAAVAASLTGLVKKE